MLDICLRKRLYNSIKQIEKHKAGYDLSYEDVMLTHMYLNKGYRSFVMCLRYINGLPFKFNNSLEELLYIIDKELCGVIYRKYRDFDKLYKLLDTFGQQQRQDCRIIGISYIMYLYNKLVDFTFDLLDDKAMDYCFCGVDDFINKCRVNKTTLYAPCEYEYFVETNKIEIISKCGVKSIIFEDINYVNDNYINNG